MNRTLFLPGLLLCLLSVTLPDTTQAQEAVPPAKELAAQLSTVVRDGSAVVRVKLEGAKPDPVLQLQIKSRRTAAGTDVLYQVLWPKERKGDGFVIRRSASGAVSGSSFTVPDVMKPIAAGDMEQAVFGSDLSYADLVENFFAWNLQSVSGQETVDRVPCVILESKPAAGDRSSYSLVRSWIDAKRMVPLRIEKFNRAGQMVRRITTTRVAKDDNRRNVAASFTVQRAGQPGVTTLEGSNIKQNITLQDSDFTAEALRVLTK